MEGDHHVGQRKDQALTETLITGLTLTAPSTGVIQRLTPASFASNLLPPPATAEIPSMSDLHSFRHQSREPPTEAARMEKRH